MTKTRLSDCAPEARWRINTRCEQWAGMWRITSTCGTRCTREAETQSPALILPKAPAARAPVQALVVEHVGSTLGRRARRWPPPRAATLPAAGGGQQLCTLKLTRVGLARSSPPSCPGVPQWRCFVGIVAFCPRYCNVRPGQGHESMPPACRGSPAGRPLQAM